MKDGSCAEEKGNNESTMTRDDIIEVDLTSKPVYVKEAETLIDDVEDGDRDKEVQNDDTKDTNLEKEIQTDDNTINTTTQNGLFEVTLMQ